MKTWKIILGVLFLCLLNTVVWGAEQELFFVTDTEFPPFGYVENNKQVGIDIEMVNEIARRLNLKIKTQMVPWNRLLEMTKKGACDASFSLFKTEEREKFALFATAEPIHYSTYRYYVRKGKEFKYEKISDLYGKTIGINSGFNISDEFDKACAEGKITKQEVENTETNIKKLLGGRFDALVDNDLVLPFVAKKMGVLDKIVALPKPAKEKRGAFLVLSKASKNIKDKKALLKQINDTLTAMRKDGTIEKIINKYTK